MSDEAILIVWSEIASGEVQVRPRNDKTIVYLKLVKLINFPDRSSSSQACPPRV